MDDSISNAISQLQNMLSSEDGKKSIENMIGSFGASPSDTGATSDFGLGQGLMNPDSFAMMRMTINDGNTTPSVAITAPKKPCSSIPTHDDPRSQLLLALKPYLSASRGARIDTAIMLLSLGKIPSIMKTMRG